MTVHTFESMDDLHAFIAGETERANAQIKPWHDKVTYGDYFVIYHDGDNDVPLTYGYIPTVKEWSNEDPFNEERVFVFAKLYNRDQPDGDYASVHISHIDVVISAQQFKQLKAAHWPVTMFTLLTAMYPTKKGKPLVFMMQKNGQFLLSRKNQRLMYCEFVGEKLAPIDEAALNEKYGMFGWHTVFDWSVNDHGDGGYLLWDSSVFLSSRAKTRR